MAHKSRRNRRLRNVSVEELEYRTMLSAAAGHDFADPNEPGRAENERRVQKPNPGIAFARLDANHDGQLVPEELSEGAWGKLSRVDANHDWAVTMEEIRAARMEDERRVQKPKPGAAFNHLDTSDDGRLTPDEVTPIAWMKLSRADANEDGAVTLQELRAAREEHEHRVRRPQPAAVFARLDLNEDGQLTADEVSEEVWAKLSQADANEDGAVTLEELRAARQEHEHRVRRPHPAEVFARLDLNEDGQLTADEVTEEVWAKLSRADANEDGAVTLQELRAAREEHEHRVRRPHPAEVFARLDLN
ncbi:MAG: hypothetical protein ABGZ53_10405, partial [Fuerstiella sp.]